MMEEAHQQQPASYQSVSGNYNPVVQGTGNATVNNYMPALTRHWLKPARQSLGNKPFVGRQELVDTLIEEISVGNNVAITGKQVVKAFQGMGGIGKTYLAIKLGIELYDRFIGGVIRIDVGPQVTDDTSAQVPLGRLASYAFGGLSPFGSFQPEQVAAWLAETAPGPFLVIFDDLWRPEPLRFLSRALPSIAIQLVTTRFTNVAQAIGAAIVPLDRLSLEDGLALLEERLHCKDNPTHRSALEALIKLLGGHALALDIAAANIKKPARLSTVLHELEQGIGKGDLSHLKLAPGDGRDEDLERSFALSYKHMTPQAQLLFRALGVFAEESLITADAAAAIWQMDDVNTAQQTLFDLADLAMLTEIEEPATGATLFRQHSLLRVYARALLEQQNELADVSRRHAQFYTDRSWQARTSSPQDYEFLTQHSLNILAALQWSELNDALLFSRLLDAIAEFLLNRGQSALLKTYLPKAIGTANRAGNNWRSANLLKSLGDLESRLGNIDEARKHYDAALPLYQREQARLGEANLLQSLGDLERRLGNIDEARKHYDAALPLYQREQARLGEANLLKSLGDLESRLGNIDEARKHYDAALPLYQREQARLGEANLLQSLGDLESRLGNIDEARKHYDAALPLYQREQARLGEANLLKSLGDLESRLGNIDEARKHYDAALPLYQREQARLGEANLLQSLGDLERRLGNIDEARKHYDAALPLYQREQARLGEANLLKSLGDLESRLGNIDEARKHYDAALPLYQREQDRLGEANLLQSLGDLERRLGNIDEARKHYDAALPLYQREQARLGEANLLQSLGDLERRLGNIR